ncbi:kinase-like domain-containing protein, partial [Catenaria anguillulae PL171]
MLGHLQPSSMPVPPPPSAWWPPSTSHHPHPLPPASHLPPAQAPRPQALPSSSAHHSLSNSSSLVSKPNLPRHAPQQQQQHHQPSTALVQPWSAILSPTLSISHFRLGELLGRGATSEVYAAFTDLPDFASLSLAIKRIPMLKLATQKDIARVQAEIQTQLIAQHPSIVRLYAAFRDHEHVYLVLELCESGTLADYLEARGKLTEPEVRYVLDAVIRGLLYLRRQGKFHRDVKPGNIMLTADNDVKIGDLGLPSQRRQIQHTVCGTINYMAPEVVANQPYSETVDMWSLGCLLVTMLKGRPPFEPPNASNEDSYEVRIKTLRGLVDGHYTLPRDLSKEVRDLIASLLQKNPERRMTLERILEHPFFAPGLP